MPFPFILPTTSALAFSTNFSSEVFPALPHVTSTQRGNVRDALKKHKRLSPTAQSSNLVSVANALTQYIPYLLMLLDDVARTGHVGFQRSPKGAFTVEWRATLAENVVPGKENARVKSCTLDDELRFTFAALGLTLVDEARTALQPLYLTNTASIGSDARKVAIVSATKQLSEAASVFDYIASQAERSTRTDKPPCAEVSAAALRAQSYLALAEATLLGVLKDDPYPAVVSQGRNENDDEWMYKAPDIPKVRAHLFARLCVAAADHAAKASSLAQAASPGKLAADFLRYIEDLRKTSRARACRFFAIDAELDGKTGDALGWLDAALFELGLPPKDASKKISGFSRLKQEWSDRREDKKVEKSTSWGADAGKLEETRVIELLEAKWSKQNDTMLTQAITPFGRLLSQMPSGREITTLKTYIPPQLGQQELQAMRAAPSHQDDRDDAQSSDDEAQSPTVIGAFPESSNTVASTSSYY